MDNPYDLKQQIGKAADYETRTQPAMYAQAVGDSCGRAPHAGEQAEKLFYYHTAEREKARSAAEFFQKNPAFVEFLELVRSGAINIHG